MPGNTKALVSDLNAKPAPQYFNPTADAYEYLQGRNGAMRVELYGPDGSPISVTDGKLNIRASEIEAILGEVSAVPTANTIADRLKQIADRLGEVSANPTADTALARLKTIEGYLDGLEAALGTQADAEATGNGSVIAILKRLRTILNDVWVDAANALNVQLTGRNVEVVTVFNAVAIADTDLLLSSHIDVSKYKRFNFIVRNTLNQEVNFILFDSTQQSGQSHISTYNGAAWVTRTEIKIPASSGISRLIDGNTFPQIKDALFEKIRVGLHCSTAPTSGSITVYLLGVVN